MDVHYWSYFLIFQIYLAFFVKGEDVAKNSRYRTDDSAIGTEYKDENQRPLDLTQKANNEAKDYFLPPVFPSNEEEEEDDDEEDDNTYLDYEYENKETNYKDSPDAVTSRSNTQDVLPVDDKIPLHNTKDNLPVFLLEPENTYVVKNKPANLKCRAANALEVYFKCNGIKTQALNFEFVDPQTGVRIIEGEYKVTREEVEEYFGAEKYQCSCFAWTSRGQIRSQPATVELAYIKKHFSVAPQSQLVKQYTQVIFRCDPPQAAPFAQLYWLKNGAPVVVDDNVQVSKEGDLVIKQASLLDMANYTCVAENLAGKRMSEPALLTVFGDHSEEVFPRGYSIYRVEWDEELATFAQVWANQCILHQDLCRSSKKFPYVGQALGMMRLSLDDWMPIHNHDFNETYLTPAKVKYSIKQVMRAWWDMKKLVTSYRDQVLGNNASEVKMNENKFLNLIYGPLTHIGCGISVYKEYAYKDRMADLFFNCIQIVCNFSTRPKFGKPIFTATPPNKPGYTIRCGCPVGYDEDEDCLCYKTGRKTPYLCKNNEKCETPVVVLPIFTVEDAPYQKNGSTVLSDTKRRYFSKQSKSELRSNTTNINYLTGGAHSRSPYISNKPSIFSRAGVFELPLQKRKQVTEKIVHNDQELRKSVAPRKDFAKVQNLISSYLDKKRHGRLFNDNFYSDGYLIHEPIVYSDYNSTIVYKLKENDNELLNLNTNIDNLRHTNAPEESDVKLMLILDKLEKEIKNIDLNTNEKGIFDEKIRKIYRTLVGKPDLIRQNLKLLSKDSNNRTTPLSIRNNINKLGTVDRMYMDKNGYSFNRPRNMHPNFYNDYISDLNYDNKIYGNTHGAQFLTNDAEQLFYRNPKGLQRKLQHDRNLRGRNYINYQRRSTDGNEYYPLASERKRFYNEKLASIQRKINNLKRSNHRNEVTEDRRIRPVRPTKQKNQQRSRKQTDHVSSYYMPDRARFIHGY